MEMELLVRLPEEFSEQPQVWVSEPVFLLYYA